MVSIENHTSYEKEKIEQGGPLCATRTYESTILDVVFKVAVHGEYRNHENL